MPSPEIVPTLISLANDNWFNGTARGLKNDLFNDPGVKRFESTDLEYGWFSGVVHGYFVCLTLTND